MKYDLVLTAPGQPAVTMNVQLKKNKMRTDMNAQGQETVQLIDMDAKTMYSYTPDLNVAVKMIYSRDPDVATDTSKVADNKPEVIGTETVDGKVCLVVQYTAQNVTTKAWIWKDKGIPIRAESTSSQGTTVTEYKNIQFVDIADSVFQLPAGVTIVDLAIPPATPR